MKRLSNDYRMNRSVNIPNNCFFSFQANALLNGAHALYGGVYPHI